MTKTAYVFDKYSQTHVDKFKTECRRYWKANVGKYFSKYKTKWGLPEKMDHRIAIYDTDVDESNKDMRLQNAITVKWSPISGHIDIGTARIMVKSVSSYETETVTIKGGPTSKSKYRTHLKSSRGPGRPLTIKQPVRNLIDMLAEGTKTTPGAFRVSNKSHLMGRRYGFRISTGSRKGTTSKEWVSWMNEFIRFVDVQLEILASKLEESAVKRVVGRHYENVETSVDDGDINPWLIEKLMSVEEF